MNFQDQIQQIFGTTDIYELNQISRDADNYRCLKADMNNSSISEKKNSWHIFWHCRTGEKKLQILPDSITFPVRRFTVR